jgi:hypothetical protein
MKVRILAVGVLAASACFAACGAPARAAFHFWAIKEIFSNADGSVQFIELFTTAPGETALDGHTLETSSDGGPPTIVILDHNVAFPTTNKHLLFATAGFNGLPGGVAPDYTLPANFFNPNAASITINWAHSTDEATFAGATLPKDGVNSLTDSNTAPGGPDNFGSGANSPTNFAGVSGSVNLGATTPIAGDFDGNGMVAAADLANWKAGFGRLTGAEPVNGDADEDNDVDGHDFLVWQRRLGSSQSAPAAGVVPEPSAAMLVAGGALAILASRRRSSR